MLAVQLPAREYATLLGAPLTDAILGAVLCTAFLFLAGLWSARHFSVVPTRMQVIFEFLYSSVYSLLKDAFGSDWEARRLAPIFLSLMLFIALANQLALFPLIFEILYNDGPLFRQPTSDLSGTVALALAMVGGANIMAFYLSPANHLLSFFPINKVFAAHSFADLMNAFIELGIGSLNIIGELAKIVSLSCRLFGNIFAGNVMVAVIMSIAVFTQYLVPVPFLILGTFSGFVQAYVFMTLTIQFMSGSVNGARGGISSDEPHLSATRLA
jgi:F-type H+-transporting ATPase subunit a